MSYARTVTGSGKAVRELMARLCDPAVTADAALYRSLMKESSDLLPLVEADRAYAAARRRESEARELLDSGADEELRASIGRPVAVYIKSIVPDRMKVKLILIDTDCTHAPARALPYFVDPETTHHLSRWVYSPASSKRLVESVFEE